jgi:Cof subfamily protein (haloacid dehalogenase superfamily)
VGNVDHHGHQRTIEAVFLDIDGTIFYDGTLIESAKEAVRLLQRQNIRVALCTGRSILHTTEVQQTLNISHATYFNGGLAISDGDVVLSSPMEEDVVQRAINFSERNDIPIILHSLSRTLVFHPLPDKYLPIIESFKYPPLQRVSRNEWTAAEEQIYQMNLFMSGTWDQKVQNEFPECLLYRWHDEAVDLQKRGCDKIHGATALLHRWNISKERAMHIGDGGNDIRMFQELGVSVAMGNATDEVKKHAKLETAPAYENGVYLALKRLHLIP